MENLTHRKLLGACVALALGLAAPLALADGRLVSWSRDTTLRVWSTQTGEGLAVLQGHTASVWGVLALAVRGTEVFAGGFFTDAGGVNVSCIARWNGSGGRRAVRESGRPSATAGSSAKTG